MTLLEEFVAITNNAELSPHEQYVQVMAASQPVRDAQDWDALKEVLASREFVEWVLKHGADNLVRDK